MDNFLSGPGIFTPDGRLSQLEFAMESVGNSNNIIAIKAQNGFVIGTEIKNETEIEDERKYPRNIFLIDKHIIIGVSGSIPDSQILVDYARTQAQQYKFLYQDDIPVNEIVGEISKIKQQFSQSRVSRPMGCSLIIAGWDKYSGLQLIRTDPSGTFSGWKALSIGSNSMTNQIILDNFYNSETNIQNSIGLLIRIIKKKILYINSSKLFDIHTFIFDHERNILMHRLSKRELNTLMGIFKN